NLPLMLIYGFYKQKVLEYMKLLKSYDLYGKYTSVMLFFHQYAMQKQLLISILKGYNIAQQSCFLYSIPFLNTRCQADKFLQQYYFFCIMCRKIDLEMHIFRNKLIIS